MDGLVLALCAGVPTKGFRLIEIDVPEVVARKEAALQAWREGGKEGAVGTFLKGRGSYNLKAADLRDVESVRKALHEMEEEEVGEEGREEEVLFIFEAVLGYMKPKEVERLLRCVSGTSPPSLPPSFTVLLPSLPPSPSRSIPTTSPSCSLLIVDTGRVAGLKGKDAVAAAVGAAFAKKDCPLEGLGGWKSRYNKRREGKKEGGSAYDALRVIFSSGLTRPHFSFLPSLPPFLPSYFLPSLTRQDVEQDLRAWGWKGNIAAQTLWEATQEQREGEREVGREGEAEEEVFDEYAAWHLFAQQSWCIHASVTPPSLPPSLPLSIRPYRPHATDHAAVMALIEEGREGAKEGRPAVASFVAKTLKKDMKLLEEGTETYPGEFWVAEEEEGEGGREGGVLVVGCVGLRVSGKKEGGREGEVVRLSVRKDRRGRGVGLRLLAFVEEVARTWVDGEQRGEGGEVEGESNSSQIEEGLSGLRRLRATTLGEEALPGALALYVERAGWVVERQSTYGGGKGEGGEGTLYHLYKDI